VHSRRYSNRDWFPLSLRTQLPPMILPPRVTCSTDADLLSPPALLSARAATHPPPSLLRWNVWVWPVLTPVIPASPLLRARASTLSRRALASLHRLLSIYHFGGRSVSHPWQCIPVYYRFPLVLISPPSIHSPRARARVSSFY